MSLSSRGPIGERMLARFPRWSRVVFATYGSFPLGALCVSTLPRDQGCHKVFEGVTAQEGKGTEGGGHGMQPGDTEFSWGGVRAVGMFGNWPQASHLCSGNDCHMSLTKQQAQSSLRPAPLSLEGSRDLWEVVSRFLFHLWPLHILLVGCIGSVSLAEEAIARRIQTTA